MSAPKTGIITVSKDYVITTSDATNEPIESTGSTMFTQMKIHKDKIAQIDAKTGEIDTFGELLQRSIRTALHMADKNVTREDIISLCTSDHINSAVPYIATQFLGAKTAPLDPCLSTQEITHLLNLVRPKIIFAAPESVSTLEKNSLNYEIVVFGQTKKHTEFSEFLKPHKNEEQFEPVKIENLTDIGFIIFSSGSTGLPKAICLSHYSFLCQAELRAHLNSFSIESVNKKLTKPPIFLHYSSLYWSLSGTILMSSIMKGFCRLLWEDFDGKEIWDLIEKYKPTNIMLIPYDVTEMLAYRRKEVDVQCVLRIVFVGSHTPRQHFMKIQEAFPEAYVTLPYGQTEAGLITLFNPNDEVHREIKKNPEKIESSGLPLGGITYKVVDKSNKNLGPGQRGELRIKSKFMMSGYYNEDCSEAFDADGWLKTGDIVYYDEDCCFYIVDRMKEAFIYRGWYIVPKLLEIELLNHPAVKQAVVIGIPKEDGHHPIALVIVNEDFQVSEIEIEKFVEDRVPEKQRLRAGVKFITSVPMTVTGKVKRRELRQMILDGKL